jgi:hypothetical protein
MQMCMAIVKVFMPAGWHHRKLWRRPSAGRRDHPPRLDTASHRFASPLNEFFMSAGRTVQQRMPPWLELASARSPLVFRLTLGPSCVPPAAYRRPNHRRRRSRFVKKRRSAGFQQHSKAKKSPACGLSDGCTPNDGHV